MSPSVLALALLCVSAPLAWSHDAAEEMTLAAKAFLSALGDEQKARTNFDFDAPFDDATSSPYFLLVSSTPKCNEATTPRNRMR